MSETEELKKLCDAGHSGYGLALADAKFCAAARTYMPRLIAVAEAASKYFEEDPEFYKGLDPTWFKQQAVRDALRALEQP